MNMSSQNVGGVARRTARERLDTFIAPPSHALLHAGALLSGAAALVHAWVIREHAAALSAAIFFAVVAFLQGAYAAALLDHGRSKVVLAFGFGGNLALILIWLAVHVVDWSNPALPIHLRIEQEAHLDTTAIAGLLLEIALVGVLGIALALRYRTSRHMLRSVMFPRTR